MDKIIKNGVLRFEWPLPERGAEGKQNTMNLKDLSKKERMGLGEQYVKKYAWCFEGLLHVLAEAVVNRDPLLIAFVAQTTAMLLKNTTERVRGESRQSAKPDVLSDLSKWEGTLH